MSIQRRQNAKDSSDESENEQNKSPKDEFQPLIKSTNTKTWDGWRWINTSMGIFFAFAAYLQLNDSDWYLWVPIYTVPCLLTFSLVIHSAIRDNIIWRAICSGTLAFYIGFCIYLLVEFARVLQPNFGFNPLLYDEGREFLGVLIIVIWLQTCRESKFTFDNSS